MTLFYEYWVGFVVLFLFSIACYCTYVVDRNDKIRQQCRIDAVSKLRLDMYEAKYKEKYNVVHNRTVDISIIF